MTPCAFIGVVLYQAGLPAGRARQPSMIMADKDVDLLAGDVHIDPGDVPGGTKLEKGGQGLLVGPDREDVRSGSNLLSFRKSRSSDGT